MATNAASDDAMELASAVRVVVSRMLRRLRSEHGFPIGQGAVLHRLAREGTHSIGQLAAAEGVRQQSMAQTVSELEALGLVTRDVDPADARRARITLTDTGRTALEAERAQRDGWLASALLRECDAAELAALRRALPALDRVAHHVDGDGDGD